jgi:uncharacterized membrane protein
MGMEKNIGAKDKTIRVIAGVILLGIGIWIQGVGGLVCAILGVSLLFTAVTGFCTLYKVFGINTCKLKPEITKRDREDIRS